MADDEQILEIVELARKTGKLSKGTNEATKALERGTAQLVVYAEDASPREIVLHIPMLAKEKGIRCAPVKQKADLGAAAGLTVATAAVAVLDAGEGKEAVEQIALEE